MENVTVAPAKVRPGLLAGGWPGGRRSMIALAGAVLLVGVGLNWGWLTAIGVAPILLSLAPCLVMCGLGLCMMKGMGKSCSSSGSKDAAGASGAAAD